MDRRYDIDISTVASEIIDGEAIVMHLVPGDYFSTDGTGCLIWQWIGEGRSRDEMLGLLAAGFARQPADIAAAVDSFLADLLAHHLVREVADRSGPALSTEAPCAIGLSAAFVPPKLNVYTDMQGLTLLDPIHDVEEEGGWPMPKRTGAGQ